MLGRYFILSGIPMTQITICKEIQKMISFIVKNLDVPNHNWETFEFITKKSGRRGPSSGECIEYYNQK